MKKVIFDKENENRPYIAANAVITKMINGELYILLGKRKNVAGNGHWYLLGGHIKMDEPYKRALKREIFEEANLEIIVGEPVWIEESMESLHHIIIYCEAILINPNQEPINKEPTKCTEIKWFSIDHLPKPLWHNIDKFIDRYAKKKISFLRSEEK
jgi:8-oxo-dGTP diphosphatase